MFGRPHLGHQLGGGTRDPRRSSPLKVARYHSLVTDPAVLPALVRALRA